MKGIALVLILFSITLYSASAAVPDKPTDLDAQDISPTQIKLSWNAPDDVDPPITGFKIEVSTSSGSYYPVAEDTGSTSTVYVHKDLVTDKTYNYRVYAINDDGTSQASRKASATPTDSSKSNENPPPAPTRLTAKDVSPTKIELSWKEPPSGDHPDVTGYKIEHKIDSGSYKVLVNNTKSTDSEYSATGLKTNAAHTFRVSALNSFGFGPASDEATATPTSSSAGKKESVVPSKPVRLKASAVSPSEIQVTWKAPTANKGPDVTSYQIEVKINDGAFNVLEYEYENLAYKHENLDPSNSYTYRLAARNSIGLGDAVTAKEQPEHTLVPTNLTVVEISPTKARLEWDPPSETYGLPIREYDVKIKLTLDKYETVESTGKPSLVLSDLETGKAYVYVVVAKFTHVASNPSDEITIKLTEESGGTPASPPSKPINLQASSSSPIQVDLTWNKPANDGGSPITGYKIDLGINDGEFITLVEDTKKTTRVFFHTERVPDTTYHYKVYAINEAGTSQASNEASATPAEPVPVLKVTVPSAPLNLNATAAMPDQVELRWDAPESDGGAIIKGYKIEVKRDSGDFGVLLDNIGKRSYLHTVSPENSTYTYKVYATNEAGAGDPSKSATAQIVIEKEEPPDPRLRVPGFPDPDTDPQRYIDRYDNETAFRDWFDGTFPDYTIYDIVGIPEPVVEPPTEEEIREKYYTDRLSEPAYKKWFDSYFADMELADILDEEPEFGLCGEGTELRDGICQIIIKS